MNEEIILKMAAPYVKNGALTYDDFDRIYDVLSLREQYVVIEILFKHKILLVDSHTDDSIILLEEDSTEDLADMLEDDQLAAVYDEDALFQDRAQNHPNDEELIYHKTVRQSNEILCSLIQQGNRQAEQDLCVKNADLVRKYAAYYGNRFKNRLEMEDLIQAGFLGLLKAAKRYDISHGTQFSTYAVFWIKQSIAREITETGYIIRIPVHMMERINKVMVVHNRLAGIGVPPQERIQQIADDLGFSEKQVRECLFLKDNYLSCTSLDMPIGDDQDIDLGDFIPTEEDASVEYIIFHRALRKELAAVLKTLTQKEQDILKLRFGWDDNNPKTLEEIGALYGVTRERIRQIEHKALRKMRHPTRQRHIKAFRED